MEKDLEILEEYLDGALEGGSLLDIQKRLATDAQLAMALDQLKSQRALRRAAYAAMEPSDLAAEQLTWRVRGAMLDQQRSVTTPAASKWSPWRIASIGSAAAACMLFGFVFGRIGQNGSVAPTVAPTVTSPGIASVADNHLAGFVAVGAAPKISVPITNEYGQVVAWQTFDNSDQAKKFTEDLNKTHGQSPVPVNSAQPTLVDSPQPAPAKVPF